MMLADVRDYIDSLGIAEHVYMGKLSDKEDKSVIPLLIIVIRVNMKPQ